MIVDAHVHIGRNQYEPVEMLLAQMELNGVSKTVLVQSTATLDNSYVLECKRRFPGRFSVVCRVDVDNPAAGDTLESLHAAGAETLRIRNFHRSPGNDPLAIWRRVADLGMSVSVGGSAEGFASPEFAELVGSLPNLTVIIEHLAGMGIYAIGADSMPSDDVFRAALTLSRFDNTAIKIHGMGEISDPPFPYTNTPPYVRMAYDAFGPDRMVWGSDWPRVTNREGYRNSLVHTMEQVGSWCPAQDIAKMFGESALRYWEFE
jgi:L-fuconolactonase